MNALAKIVGSCLAVKKKKQQHESKGFKGFATFLALFGGKRSAGGVCALWTYKKISKYKQRHRGRRRRGEVVEVGGVAAGLAQNMLPTFDIFNMCPKADFISACVRVWVCVYGCACVRVCGLCLWVCLCASLCFCRFSALTFALIFDSCLGGRKTKRQAQTHTHIHPYTLAREPHWKQ